jgi:hypothetical protein
MEKPERLENDTQAVAQAPAKALAQSFANTAAPARQRMLPPSNSVAMVEECDVIHSMMPENRADGKADDTCRSILGRMPRGAVQR